MNTRASSPAPLAGIGTTALARVQIQSPCTVGVEDVTRERRFGDATAARAWLTSIVGGLSPDASVSEVSVQIERWRHGPWHARSGRQVIAVQVASVDRVCAETHRLTWGEPQRTEPRAGARYAPRC